MPRHIISIDLKDQKGRFDAFCETSGFDRVDRADFLRKAVASAIGTEQPKRRLRRVEQKTGKRKLVSTTVSPEIYNRLMDAVEVSGARSLSEYLSAVAEAAAPMTIKLSSNVGRGLPPETIRKIGESNLQLLAIGRNLNQIAKSLNLYPGQTTPKDRDMLRSIRRVIDRHIDAINDAMAVLLPKRTVIPKTKSGSK